MHINYRSKGKSYNLPGTDKIIITSGGASYTIKESAEGLVINKEFFVQSSALWVKPIVSNEILIK